MICSLVTLCRFVFVSLMHFVQSCIADSALVDYTLHLAPPLQSRVSIGNSPVHKRQPSSTLARVTTDLNGPLIYASNLLTQLPPRPGTLPDDNKRYSALTKSNSRLAKQNGKVAAMAKVTSTRKGTKMKSLINTKFLASYRQPSRTFPFLTGVVA